MMVAWTGRDEFGIAQSIWKKDRQDPALLTSAQKGKLMNRSITKSVAKPGALVVQILAGLGVAGWILYRSIPTLDFSGGIVWSALVFPAVGVLMLVLAGVGLARLPLAMELNREGKLVEGMIVGMRSYDDSDGDRTHVVVYKYLDGIEVQQRVTTSQYRSLGPGAAVQVRYLGRDPEKSRLEL
ncbi:MAG: DUF3592 domain-containing protein [Anaerolineales bacterium]|nr:DUF3592 domain-containing protein [Anaerolineales bacterium]